MCAEILRESPLRSLLKAITYRLTGTVTTAGVAFVVTGDVASALAISGIELGLKIVVYYLHERAWQLVPVGTVRRWWHRRRPDA